MILVWQSENWDKKSMLFGYIRYVKGDCPTNYTSCTPDPDCYPFIAPASKCLELTSGV